MKRRTDKDKDNYSMEPTRLGALVAARRKELGLKQSELSLRIGQYAGYMQQVESGRLQQPPWDVCERLAAVLGLSPRAVLAAAGHRPALLPAEIEEDIRQEVRRILAMTPDEQQRALALLPASLEQSIHELIQAHEPEILRRGAPPRTEE